MPNQSEWTEEDDEIMREVFLKGGLPSVREKGLLKDKSDSSIYYRSKQLGLSRRDYQRERRRELVEEVKGLAEKGLDAREISEELDGEFGVEYIVDFCRKALITLTPLKSRSRKPYTPEEDDVIRERYPEEGMDVASSLNRSRMSVSGRANRLGVRKKSHIGSLKSADPEQIRRMYWDLNLTLEEVGHVFNVSYEAVRKFMVVNNIPTRDRGGVHESRASEKAEREAPSAHNIIDQLLL